MSFIVVNNRDNFLLGKVESLHPQSTAYLTYWREQKKRCIEGFWSLDDSSINLDITGNVDYKALTKKHKQGWRYIPPQLYFYCNFGTILHQPEGASRTSPKKRIRPYLRDVEWEFFYNWLEARGFSGFEDDEEYSCHKDLEKKEAGEDVEEMDPSCFNSKGKLKKYLSPNKYLRKTFNKPMGLPLYQNQALNLFMLGARGFGKSFMVGVGIFLHELLFDGARYYSQESINNPAKVELLMGAALSDKSSEILGKTREALDNLPGAWGDGDEYIPCPFAKQMAGSLKPNNGKNLWRHEYEKKIGGAFKKIGTRSNIKHVTFTTENPEAGAGGRYTIMSVEEVGLCSNLLTVHGSNTACMMEGMDKFGSAIYLGTGGNMEKIVESETIFRDPAGFEFVAFEDEWENTGKIGWFVSSIYGLNQFKDENGNTNVEAATRYKEKVREDKLKSKDSSAIDLEMMNYPLVPSEMFLSKVGNMFPINMLKNRLGDVEGNDKYKNAEYVGDLVINSENEKIEWKPNAKLKPIYKINLNDKDDKEGCVVIYRHPYIDQDGETPYGRYLAGCDPYDHDKSGTGSLGSTIVYDKLTKEVVAEYTGRPATAKMYYETVRRMLKYYNAKVLYENERKGIYDYFEGKGCLYLLAEQPAIIKDVLQKSKVNRGYGMHMNEPLKRYGEELIKTWLLEEYNDRRGSDVFNLHKLKCTPLMKELIAYNPEGNFDRVMAFMMVVYYIQETKKQQILEEHQAEIKDIRNSDFFSKGLNRRGSNIRL